MLTETAIQEIEKATGIKGLQELIASSEQKDVVMTKTKHFDDPSYDIMYQNILDEGKRNGYTEGKVAGVEMQVKEIKRAKGYDFEGKDFDSLANFLEEKSKTTSDNTKEKFESELTKDIEALRMKLSDKDNEVLSLSKKMKDNHINSSIDNYFNSLQIEVPAHIKDEQLKAQFVKTELDKNKNYFKSQYQFEIGDNNNIIPMDLNGEVLKDEVQRPLGIESLVKGYVKSSFMNLKQERKSRGDGDYTNVHDDLGSIKTQDEFVEYAEKKGAQANTGARDALFIEWQKTQ